MLCALRSPLVARHLHYAVLWGTSLTLHVPVNPSPVTHLCVVRENTLFLCRCHHLHSMQSCRRHCMMRKQGPTAWHRVWQLGPASSRRRHRRQ